MVLAEIDADPALFLTWEDEIDAREKRARAAEVWTTHDELAAQTVDRLAVLYQLYLAAHSKPGAVLPPIRWVPRPGQPDPNVPEKVSPRALAEQMMRG